ncbi:MAG TPA: hypothetical protein VJN63_10315 [Thermoplasmata archaeon]|nr:hypothetical protein [Thermoplasmata archaeon]
MTRYVLEVNASPEFRRPLEATSVNAVDAIVEYPTQKAKVAAAKAP